MMRGAYDPEHDALWLAVRRLRIALALTTLAVLILGVVVFLG